MWRSQENADLDWDICWVRVHHSIGVLGRLLQINPAGFQFRCEYSLYYTRFLQVSNEGKGFENWNLHRHFKVRHKFKELLLSRYNDQLMIFQQKQIHPNWENILLWNEQVIHTKRIGGTVLCGRHCSRYGTQKHFSFVEFTYVLFWGKIIWEKMQAIMESILNICGMMKF